jgi:bacterioferritin
MNKYEIIEKLNEDLKNEWKHLRFYLHHAATVVGLHREEYKEFFMKSASSEMNHVNSFSELIIGLGGTPTCESNNFHTLTKVQDILNYALRMEEEVVSNYVQRIEELSSIVKEDSWATTPITDSDIKWIEIFLEDQISDSRRDADHIKQILKENEI